MKKVIVAVTAAAALIIPSTASAAPIKECGDFSIENIVNVTARNVPWCKAALEFAIYYERNGRIYNGPNAYPKGMRLVLKRYRRVPGKKYGLEDLRFSNGWQVIRYQSVIDD